MIVQCPSCASRYRVNDANVPPSGGKITCPSCQHKFIVYPEQEEQPEPQGAVSDMEDKTSVAFRPDLQQLVSKMQGGQGGQGGGQEPVNQATEVMSGEHVPDFLDDMAGEDGTVEMKNPFQDGNLPGFNRKGGQDESDEVDVAATEVVSGDMLDGLGFDDPSAPAGTSGQQGRSQQKPPGQPPSPGQQQGRSQQKPPSQPPSPGQQQGRSQQKPPSPGQQQGRSQQQPPSQPPSPGQQQGRSQQQPPSPGQQQGQSQQQPPSPAQQQSPASPQDASGQSAASVSAGPSSGAGSDGPDPAHEGPWKLKTNFGLTYEFPDTDGLKNWLSNREELDGYELSGDDDAFYALGDWPQLDDGSGGAGNDNNRRQIPSFKQDDSPPAPKQPPSNPSFGLGGGGPAPNPAAGANAGGFDDQPAAAPPPGKKIKPAEYNPPSRNAGSGLLLWGIFLILAVVASAISVQTFGIFDIKGFVEVEILGQQPPEPDSEETVEQEAVDDADDSAQDDQVAADEQNGPDPRVAREVDRLLGDARRAERNNRLQSASEKLKNAQLLDPERVAVYEMQADVYEQMGQHEEAEKAKERAEQLASGAGEQEAAEEASTN